MSSTEDQFEFKLEQPADTVPKVGIVDADSIMFNLGWYYSKADLMAPENPGNMDTPPEFIYTAVETFLRKLRTQMGVDVLHLHFSASSKNKELFEEFMGKPMQTQFRSSLGSTYKSNRKNAPLPTGYHYTLRALLDQPNAYIHDKWEADEAVLLHKKMNPEWVLSSNDKDVYKQHCGKNWRYDKRQKWEDIPASFANYFAFFQAITGDPVDGFGGVPGIGPKKAEEFVKPVYTPTQNWEGVLKAFASKGLSDKEALINMRFANMHQLKLDDEGKPIIDLWTPSGSHLQPVWV